MSGPSPSLPSRDADALEAPRPGPGDALAVLVFSAVYFPITVLLAHRKILWTDEIVTLHIATLPSAVDVWHALANGGDTLPPLGHYLTRVSLEWFGGGHVAARLPALAGFWCLCVCLYLFVRAYTPRASAVVAMLTPVVATFAYPYAFEARPYALLLGFGAAALLCWQRACLGRLRPVWLLALGVSLAAAVSSHWYGVLLAVPLGCGELARLRSLRRPDFPVWTTIVAGVAIPLLIGAPLIEHARMFQPAMSSGTFYGPAQVVDAYQQLLGGTAPLLLGILLLAALPGPAANTIASGPEAPMRTVPLEVTAALAGFLLIPIWGAVLGSIATGVFGVRYMLPTIIGVAATVGLLSARLAVVARSPEWMLVLVACAASGCGVYEAKLDLPERSIITSRSGVFALLNCQSSNDAPAGPIVVTDVHSFYVLRQYAPALLADRLVYLTEYNAIGSRLSAGLATSSPWSIVDYKTFVEGHSDFLLYESQYFSRQIGSPLMARLAADGYTISRACVAVRDTYPRPGQLYKVSGPR